MKTKPVKHKTTNTFRFLPFAERINAIDIRHAALYHIEHANIEQPEENETHFHITLRKWHVLNLTDNFKKFKKDVFGVITLPQLVHKKDVVVRALEKYLEMQDEVCLQPLLEILVSLAKDLREDFYPHFPKFLDILIKLLDTKNADQLEWTLVCLAFLFKILKPFLKKDIAAVLKRIIPLLSENKPQYINNFAAESFAFVARDIRDKKKFIHLIINYLQTNEDAITGCGHLLFEIIRGVQGKFHSCIESFIPILLQHLKENKSQQEILFKVMTQMIEDCLQSISHKEYGVFWTSIIKYTEEILKENDEESKGLEYILRLSGQVIEHDDGRYLVNPPQFVLLLVKVICEQTQESVLEVCATIGALLLLSQTIALSQEHAGIIVKVLLPLPYPNVLISFVNNVIDYSQFDMHILPQFLSYVVNSDFDSEAVYTLTKICLRKAPLSKNGIKLFEWVKYPLEFGKALPLFEAYFEKVLAEDLPTINEKPERILNLLICLPHVERFNVEKALEKIRDIAVPALTSLTQCNLECQKVDNKLHSMTTDQSKFARKLLFIIANVIECAAHISSCKRVKEIVDVDTLLLSLLPCASDPNYLVALHCIDLYLTAYEHEYGLTLPLLSLVDSFLKENMLSPFHVVRLLTTHIYKLFENIEEMKKTAQVGTTTETLSVFSLCYNVESIQPSIQDYRNQISMLQKMAFNTTQYALLKETAFSQYALNYMLGVLYMNFKLLWEPVSEFIAGYGNALPVEEFWPTFHKALECSFANANKDLKSFKFDEEIDTAFPHIKETFADYNNISERPDLYNYRNLILKIMTNCIQVCEAKNRDVVVLFLNFIDNQYRNNNKMNSLTINVELHDKMEVADTPIDDIEIPEEEDEKESVSGKIIFKTLINVMQVLSKFKNPRALYREPEFWNLFMEFLMNKNPGLQKYALDCVLNYRNKSVTPYKDNLINLVDDKKFKDEMTLFTITEGTQSIHADDREHVLPLILRILYGKMTSKLVADKKGGGQTRRAMVMRYISGCSEKELRMFIEMSFTHFSSYFAMSPREIYETTNATQDLKVVTSPSKLHSILNLFDVIREYFGGYMKEELLAHFFKIFFAVSSIVATVLAREDKVHVGYLKVMKNLRTLLLGSLRNIFDTFHTYPWKKDELYVVFETLIWPLISKLHIEGVYSPTALMKLLNSLCQNPRYYKLLITCSEKENLSAIPEIFKLLKNPKTNVTVVNMILDMIEKLITLTEEEQNEVEVQKVEPIETFKTLEVDSKIAVNINFGSRILIPHIPSILEVMKKRFAKSAKSNTVNKRDLLILSRVTELVANPELCDELLSLLLPILVKKVCMNMAEENMEYAINTIINLLNHSTKPQAYIKNISVLFNKVNMVEVRKLLLKTLNSIAARATVDKEVLTRLANVITEMNAFNKRWIEQPDFDRRLDAYKEIYRLSDNNEIDLDLAILIVNNCFYFIRTEKDIGLRDSASLCMKKILPRLLLKYRSVKDGEFLVRETVLALISNGIRDTKHELVRNESIALLGELARECPDADTVLKDLSALTNKEDVEVDFFENMCHLQQHRRVRALQKFTKVFKKVLKCPTPRTITNFILPLASTYICDDKYTDKNTLIDACIDVISTSCKLLPWYHYEVILKLYLNKLRHDSDHQKQLTRILIGIIDAFHFDFSKVKDFEFPKALMNNMQIGNTGRRKKVVKSKDSDEKEVVKDESRMDVAEDDENILKDEKAEGEEINEGDETQEDLEPKEEPLDLNEELKLADEAEANDQEQVKETTNVAAYERITSVSPSVGKRILKSLASGLLPQLNRAIGKLTEHDSSHKVNRRRTGLERQQEELLRVPLALPLVTLLQRLPPPVIRNQLPGIIIKLCSFLKSPLKQVRITARDIVKKVMITVGTSYLGILLEHLTMLLTRGFQVHVLVATIHSVLDDLKQDFKPGEINENLDYILDVCSNDLFGSLSEEKEVEKLHYKTPEAKPSKKSYVTLMIVAQNITEQCLINLLLPFKDVLQKHHSKKIVLKVQEALTHITAGLVTNKYIDIESLFVFLHGVASDSIPEFVLGAPKREITEAQREKMLRAKPDCFIIPQVPKRSREVQASKVKTSSKANAHVLVEFSLNILYVILKREKVPKVDCKAFVDPLIPLLVDALNSNHIKVATVALKCFATLWTIRVSTPALEENVKGIVKTIFIILHKYATFEISKQNDNYHFVRNAFKAITVLIRNVKYHTLEADQLKTLLLYAEQDCQNDERQNVSFSLLKAILEAKLVSPELHEVMDKVAKICILSESAKSREEARVIFATYLTQYAAGKRSERHVQFFVSQLNYEMQHGRESALKFLEIIIHKMPLQQLIKQASFLLLSLSSSTSSDPAPELRAAAAAAAEALLHKLDKNTRNSLHDLTCKFYSSAQPEHYEFAAQICIRFVNVEGDEYKTRLPALLPIITSKLLLISNDASEGRFVKLQLENDTEKSDEEVQRDKDHCLIQMLNLLDSIMVKCPASLTFHTEVDDIAQQCQAFLAYPHAWVRLRAAKVLSHILNTVEQSEIEDVLKGRESERGFLYYDTENAIRSLVLDLCAQFVPGVVDKETAEQVTAVLFQILKLVYAIPSFKLTSKKDPSDDGEAGGAGVSVRWIIYKMRRAVNAEVAKAPTTSNIRTSIFTAWIHIISFLETEDLEKIIEVFLPPIVRELSIDGTDDVTSAVRQMAARVGKKLRRRIGDIDYGKLVAEAQTRLNVRRAERKKVYLQEKVHDPEKAAKRKMHLKEKKKQSKKIKLEMVKGKRPRPKKRKAEDDIEDAFLKDEN